MYALNNIFTWLNFLVLCFFLCIGTGIHKFVFGKMFVSMSIAIFRASSSPSLEMLSNFRLDSKGLIS
jgi:hypothetical protein